jgi:hypothetical protein
MTINLDIFRVAASFAGVVTLAWVLFAVADWIMQSEERALHRWLDEHERQLREDKEKH